MFFKRCGEESRGEKALNPFQIDDNKLKYRKIYRNNKKIKWSIIVIIIIGFLIGINDYKSKNVSKKVIQNDFIGTKFNYGTMEIVINKENLKSIELREKIIEKSGGTKTYNNTGTIILETDKYRLELPIEIRYIYDKRNRSWLAKANSIHTYDDEIKFTIKEKISEDIIKSKLIGQKVNGVEITPEIAKELVINSMKENKEGTSITTYSNLENRGKFVTKKMIIKSVINFDGENWVLNEYGSKSDEETIIVTKPSLDLSMYEIKKDLSMIINDKKFVGYNGFKIIEVSLDEIDSIKKLDVDILSSDSYVITAEVSGKNDALNFEGNIKITALKKGNTSCEIKFNKFSFDNTIEE